MYINILAKLKYVYRAEKGKRRCENDNGRNSYKIIYFFY